MVRNKTKNHEELTGAAFSLPLEVVNDDSGKIFLLWTGGGRAAPWKDVNLIERTAVRNIGNGDK